MSEAGTSSSLLGGGADKDKAKSAVGGGVFAGFGMLIQKAKKPANVAVHDQGTAAGGGGVTPGGNSGAPKPAVSSPSAGSSLFSAPIGGSGSGGAQQMSLPPAAVSVSSLSSSSGRPSSPGPNLPPSSAAIALPKPSVAHGKGPSSSGASHGRGASRASAASAASSLGTSPELPQSPELGGSPNLGDSPELRALAAAGGTAAAASRTTLSPRAYGISPVNLSSLGFPAPRLAARGDATPDDEEEDDSAPGSFALTFTKERVASRVSGGAKTKDSGVAAGVTGGSASTSSALASATGATSPSVSLSPQVVPSSALVSASSPSSVASSDLVVPAVAPLDPLLELDPSCAAFRQCTDAVLHARSESLLAFISPSSASESRYTSVLHFLEMLIKRVVGAEVFCHGSFALKTYLPDADLDVSAFFSRNNEEVWVTRLVGALCQEAATPTPGLGNQFLVKSVSFINGQVQVVKCQIGSVPCDISGNQTGALATLALFEEVDKIVGRDHLFKRTILLTKAWAQQEAGIVDSGNGLMSSYCLRAFVLFIFNAFHKHITTPLQGLYMLLSYFGQFDFARHAVGLFGPISLEALPRFEVVSEGPCAWPADGVPLISRELLQTYSLVATAAPVAPGAAGAAGGKGKGGSGAPAAPAPVPETLPHCFLNCTDPCNPSNNLGRSVQQRCAPLIREAFVEGSRAMRKMMSSWASHQDSAARRRAEMGSAFGAEEMAAMEEADAMEAYRLVSKMFAKTIQTYGASAMYGGRPPYGPPPSRRGRVGPGASRSLMTLTETSGANSRIASGAASPAPSYVLGSNSPILRPGGAGPIADFPVLAPPSEGNMHLRMQQQHQQQQQQQQLPVQQQQQQHGLQQQQIQAQQQQLQFHQQQQQPQLQQQQHPKHFIPSASPPVLSGGVVPSASPPGLGIGPVVVSPPALTVVTGGAPGVAAHAASSAAAAAAAQASPPALDANLGRILDNLSQARQFEVPDVSEQDLVGMIRRLLMQYGSVPVGKLGSLLHNVMNNHSLPSLLKERYGGLKKFLIERASLAVQERLPARTLPIQVPEGCLVSAVQEEIAEKSGIPVAEQRVMFSGQEMDPTRSLDSYGVQPAATLHLILRPPVAGASAAGAGTSSGASATDALPVSPAIIDDSSRPTVSLFVSLPARWSSRSINPFFVGEDHPFNPHVMLSKELVQMEAHPELYDLPPVQIEEPSTAGKQQRNQHQQQQQQAFRGARHKGGEQQQQQQQQQQRHGGSVVGGGDAVFGGEHGFAGHSNAHMLHAQEEADKLAQEHAAAQHALMGHQQGGQASYAQYQQHGAGGGRGGQQGRFGPAGGRGGHQLQRGMGQQIGGGGFHPQQQQQQQHYMQQHGDGRQGGKPSYQHQQLQQQQHLYAQQQQQQQYGHPTSPQHAMPQQQAYGQPRMHPAQAHYGGGAAFPAAHPYMPRAAQQQQQHPYAQQPDDFPVLSVLKQHP